MGRCCSFLYMLCPKFKFLNWNKNTTAWLNIKRSIAAKWKKTNFFILFKHVSGPYLIILIFKSIFTVLFYHCPKSEFQVKKKKAVLNKNNLVYYIPTLSTLLYSPFYAYMYALFIHIDCSIIYKSMYKVDSSTNLSSKKIVWN